MTHAQELQYIAEKLDLMRFPETADRIRRIADELEALKAEQPAAQVPGENPLAKRCYTMSEPHLSGYRLILGFDTLEAVQEAHEFVAKAGKHLSASPKPPEQKP